MLPWRHDLFDGANKNPDRPCQLMKEKPVRTRIFLSRSLIQISFSSIKIPKQWMGDLRYDSTALNDINFKHTHVHTNARAQEVLWNHLSLQVKPFSKIRKISKGTSFSQSIRLRSDRKDRLGTTIVITRLLETDKTSVGSTTDFHEVCRLNCHEEERLTVGG